MRTRVQRARGQEQGYALLMVIFLVGLMLAASAVVVPDILTQGKRQKEDLMIWRGEQYERGVKLYFKKKGKYPTQLDDITKDQDGIRFMRQVYKDPMNTEDGSWRLIYVTAAGQLIGSLNYQTLQQMATTLRPNAPGAGGTTPGAPAAGQPGSPGGLFGNAPPLGGAGGNQQGGAPGGPPAPGSPPNGTGGAGAPGAGGTGTIGDGTGTGTGTDSNSGDDSNTGEVLGGSITGVGSKINKPSLKVYQKAVKYKKWEFIWNPLLDVAGGAGGPGSGGPQTPGGTPGAPGIGQPVQGQSPFGSGGNPQQGAPPSAPPPGGAL
jgi:hypothetical protein